MEITTLIEFFKWCTILNGALLLWVSFWVMAAPDQMYRWQGLWMKLPREQYDPVMFGLVGLFKILFLVFNLFPLIALTLIR
jgi:hypothetical protein